MERETGTRGERDRQVKESYLVGRVVEGRSSDAAVLLEIRRKCKGLKQEIADTDQTPHLQHTHTHTGGKIFMISLFISNLFFTYIHTYDL